MFDERILRQRAEDLYLIVHDRFRHAGHHVAAREVGELRRFDRNRGDVRIGEGDFVREADRPRAVRSGRRREHLERQRPVDGGDLLPAAFGETRLASADQQHGVDERHEFIARRRAQEPDPRVFVIG